MPCCAILLFLFIGPRVALAALAFFSNYLGRAYDSLLWPFLGFFFLPWTTLAYAWAINTRGEVAGFHAVVVVFSVLVDLGVVGNGASKRKKKRE